MIHIISPILSDGRAAKSFHWKAGNSTEELVCRDGNLCLSSAGKSMHIPKSPEPECSADTRLLSGGGAGWVWCPALCGSSTDLPS